MSKKRTLDTFFKPLSQQTHQNSQASTADNTTKKQRVDLNVDLDLSPSPDPPSTHPTYPFPIPQLPASIASALGTTSTKNSTSTNNPDYSTTTTPLPLSTDHFPSPRCPASLGRPINDQPFLDLVYFEPFIPRPAANALFTFLRASLPFYRVRYHIKRGGIDTLINTPRYTTVFGVDESSTFAPPPPATTGPGSGDTTPLTLVDRISRTPVAQTKYKCRPRPLPASLDALRRAAERETGERFNFCLVNYYASGDDSIAYHSDDERFLGPEPAIASVSLGARRDFLMRRKPEGKGEGASPPLKLPLGSGDMVLMRGKTQANWLHSVPKRRGGEGGRGRVNVTFRKAMVRGGTENYYQYNVGGGPVYRWDEGRGEMRVWEESKEEVESKLE